MRLVRALLIPTFLCFAAFACQRAPEFDVAEVAGGVVANAQALAEQFSTYSSGDASASAVVWNQVLAPLAASRSGVARIETLEDDVRIVVLEDGKFVPVSTNHITAVQFSDAAGVSVCHVIGSPGPAVIQGPCQ